MINEAPNNYVLGAGKVYFNQFKDEDPLKAMGLRYLGSTSEFNLTSETETLQHQNSEGGMRHVDMEVPLSTTMTGSLTTDNISAENMALYFSGDYSKELATAATAITQTVKLRRGSAVLIGSTAAKPQGEAAVTNVKVALTATPATTLVAGKDYDLVGNMIVCDDGTNSTALTATDVEYTITYDRSQSTRDVVVAKGNSIVGLLLFKANNGTGKNYDYLIPKCRLVANGDYAIKGGDDWQQMSMSVSVMKDGNKPMMYINGTPTVV